MTVYQMIDVVGTSGTSVSDAIRGAIERTSGSVEEIQWFEVKEIRGRVNGDEPEYQVKLQIGAVLPAVQNESTSVSAEGRRAGSRETRSQAAQVAAKKGAKGRSELAKGFEKQRGTTKGKK